jgi:5'-3' exonuclease
MGIKNLNQYMLKHCSSSSIQKINFETLKHKTIVIDISIYLYKFMTYGNFMENVYSLLSILKYYLITPIFVFDGKPPPEKWALLKKRRWEKKDAEARYMELQNSVLNNDISLNEIENEMEELRKKMVRVKPEDIKKVKELMDAFGLIYYDAPGEADQLCAYLVNEGVAWACLSDDMDMFLYGCPCVLRNLSLMNHQVMMYDTSSILKDLSLSLEDFLEIAILCGTDYNDGYHSLHKTLILHNEYKQNITDHASTSTSGFYQWFIQKSEVDETMNFKKICNMFDLKNNGDLEKFAASFKKDLSEKSANIHKLKEIMREYGFIFL